MSNSTPSHQSYKVALITGGAKRIGKAISQKLHQDGFCVIIHYHHSESDAILLSKELNHLRPNSAHIIKADLGIINDKQKLQDFHQTIMGYFGRLDIIVHNASSFYPSNLWCDDLNKHWDDLFLTNAKAPLILSTLFAKELIKNHGAIISLLDIHAQNKPLMGYPIYTMAKSAHLAMTQALALEFAPHVRVNGVAPGVNILPTDDQNSTLTRKQSSLIKSVPLGRIGKPSDVADVVLFLAKSDYMTGQVLAVDGGRGLTLMNG